MPNISSVLEELFGICVDGAPSMVDPKKSSASLIKQKIWILSQDTALFTMI